MRFYFLGKADYPRRELNEAWEKILRAQFHDVLPGSCNYEAYEEVYHELEETIGKLRSMSNNTLKAMFTNPQTTNNNVIIFNMLNWGWRILVKLPMGRLKSHMEKYL
ncbi:MAG: hypothetical protein QXX09_00525 [Candidatus Methanomethylicia archaeon]